MKQTEVVWIERKWWKYYNGKIGKHREKSAHLCLQAAETQRQTSNDLDGDSVRYHSSSNVAVYKIRSHQTDSESDDTDDAQQTIGKLGTFLDVWQGIDYAERSLWGRNSKWPIALLPSGADDISKPGSSCMEKPTKKSKNIKNQKKGFYHKRITRQTN